MPQFAVETFPSQIFWVIFGFFAIYLFMSFYVTPNLQKTLRDRDAHVGALVGEAESVGEKAKKMEEEARIALKKAETDSALVESKLIASFKEESTREQQALIDFFSEESQKKSHELALSSDECFAALREDSADIVDAAARRVC